MTFEKKYPKKFFNGSIPASAYPNDEIFIATVTRRLGMKCAAIDGKISSSNFFLLLRSDPENVLLEEQVETIKADMVMHPVLSEERFLENRKNQFNKLLRRSRDFSYQNKLWFALNKTKNKDVQKKVEEMFVEEFKRFFISTQRWINENLVVTSENRLRLLTDRCAGTSRKISEELLSFFPFSENSLKDNVK